MGSIKKHSIQLSLMLILMLVSSGCAIKRETGEERSAAARALALEADWTPVQIHTEHGPLVAFGPADSGPIGLLTIYIEGDGKAWLNRSTPSSDPTPGNPVALKLALRHPGPAAYLARPCQYLKNEDNDFCQRRYWTDARFAEPVVAATNRAIDQLKARYRAGQVQLVGFSGGGAVAALVAARREDIYRLVTIAGNLDHQAWTELHRLSPLSQSLNPAEVIDQLEATPQLHLTGADDTVIPPSLVAGFVERFPAQHRPTHQIVEATDHHCCWEALWPTLLEGAQPPTP